MSVETLDLQWRGRPGSIGSFVVPGDDGVALVETGPASCLDAQRAALDALGLGPRDVRGVLVTHIHLDHAGAAWWWARHGGADGRGVPVHVHAFGARHLVDPSRLLASARRIYGARMEALWGELHPIDAGRVVPLRDGDRVVVAGRAFRAIETPGHARHHHALHLEDEDVCFAGDVAGMVAPGSTFLVLPTPAPELDLAAWRESVERLAVLDPGRLVLTHFGAVADPRGHLRRVRAEIEAHAAFLEIAGDDDALPAEYARWYRRRAEAAGLDVEAMRRAVGGDLLPMNAAGLIRHRSLTRGVAAAPA